ncbi:hypothetical protein M8818_006964 [Zalaria obscura]|uniref:Uncharacterized protein n=1 Tax=Zalaria obscura TaxID=2024903 RepID=A0ACC3S8I2_9PEZI
MAQPLPSKEQTLFRHVVQNYESKQFKKGLKAAEQILRKVPNHGDTQAMKALILNSQGKSEEAFELAKVALKNAMKSHVCWHVYGLLYRHVKNYEEAIKAYKFALRLDPESVQIQRDLALLQVQMRDYQGFIASRKNMLQARSSFRQNWTAMAIAHHLAGDLEAAENVLKTYEDTLKNPPPRTDMEHAEAVLYKNTIIAESGDIKRALEHLDTFYKKALDRTAVMELRASYLLQLERKEEAEKAYRALLARNAEKRSYYDGLEKALGLSRENKEDQQKLVEMYKEFADKSDRIDAARRVPLDFLEGDAFREAADTYLRRMFRKGVPSTFANIKALYTDASKRQTIQDLVEGHKTEDGANGAEEKQTNGDKANYWQLAVNYFLAQHYNYPLSQDLSKAMEYIDKTIELNPKPSDYTFHMTKARIYKHMGNVAQASKTMNEAREMDLKDRYINTKCAKYQLRNDQNDDAISTMGLFTRKEAVGGPLGDLVDMQCMWFLYEDGASFLRQGKFSLALKRFKTIYDIFDTWQEDQFDFHSFSLRKGQIRAYVDMIRWEDSIREHPFYSRAAFDAIKVYTMVADNPQLANGDANGDQSEAERKKAAKKAKKEQERIEAEKKAAKAVPTGDGETKKEDPDPMGFELINTKDPLGEAMKFLTPLLEQSPKNIKSQLAGFEVYIRRRKFLPALKCLIAASSLDSENPTLHQQIIRFRQALDSASEPLPDQADEVVKSEFTLIPSSTSPADFNDAFLSKHKDSAPHVQSALAARQVLDPKSQSQNEKDLQATLELPEVQIEDAIDGLALLKQWKSAQAVQEAYVEAAKKRWAEATVFHV